VGFQSGCLCGKTGTVEFRILGPLEVLDEGEPVPLGTLKERIVLATLLLHSNEVVSRTRLIDELWGESPPPTAKKAVNVYVSQLRKTLTLNGHDLIATVAGGYRLELEPEDLDTARMQRLLAHACDRAAAGEPERATELFREALALWRGPTLPDLPFESLARIEVEQLDEVRLAALMDRIDCELALGRHQQVLGEVNLLVREHPLRERLRAQQMLALYRADRQAEALDAYAEARRTLVDDLGIEPSEALQRLQRAILRHDPSLETPEGTAAVNGLAPSAAASPPTPATDVRLGESHSRRRFRPRRWQLAVAGLVVLTAAAATTLSTSSARATPHVVANSLVRLDPRSGKPTLVVPVGVEPGPIAFTPTAIWTVNHGDRTVSRYDLRTDRVQTRGGFPHQPYDVVADMAGNVWVSSKTPIVTRLAAGVGGTSAGPLYPSKTATIRVRGPGVGHEALGAGYVWAIVGPLTYPAPGLPHREDDRLSLIDMQSDRVASSMRLRRSTTSIAFGYGSAWIGAYDAGGSWLAIISAGSIKPEWIRLVRGESCGPPYDPGPYGAPLVATGAGSVWVLTCGQSNQQQLIKVDPETHRIVKRTSISYLDPASFLAVGAGSVWLAGASVSEIDPVTNKLVRTIPVGGRTKTPCGIAATQDTVWVAIGDSFCDTIGQ
jgi:DNA-binding SARP family transcriptional activator